MKFLLAAGSRRARPRESGLSLLELIVALAVIAVALLQVFNVLIGSNQTKQVTREFTVARHVVAGEIETLRARGKTYGLTDVSGWIQANPTSSTNRLTQGVITRQVDTTNPNLYSVTVTVTWQGGPGKNNKFFSSAMISR